MTRHSFAFVWIFLLYFILFIYLFPFSCKAPAVIPLPAHTAWYLTQALNHLSLHRQRPWHHAGVMSSLSLTARQQTNLTIHQPSPTSFFVCETFILCVRKNTVTDRKLPQAQALRVVNKKSLINKISFLRPHVDVVTYILEAIHTWVVKLASCSRSHYLLAV